MSDQPERREAGERRDAGGLRETSERRTALEITLAKIDAMTSEQRTRDSILQLAWMEAAQVEARQQRTGKATRFCDEVFSLGKTFTEVTHCLLPNGTRVKLFNPTRKRLKGPSLPAKGRRQSP